MRSSKLSPRASRGTGSNPIAEFGGGDLDERANGSWEQVWKMQDETDAYIADLERASVRGYQLASTAPTATSTRSRPRRRARGTRCRRAQGGDDDGDGEGEGEGQHLLSRAGTVEVRP